MNKDILLKKILNNESLKKKYWPDLENTKGINVNTLLRKSDELQNDYLKLLHTLFNNMDSSKRAFNQSISNLF